MQGHELLKSLFNDRVSNDSQIIENIEKEDYEPALLTALQLLSDLIVHCSEYLPAFQDTILYQLTSSQCTEEDFITTNDSNLAQ